jgi:MFS family permease
VVGVISPSGNEVGPFLPIEQAALAQTITDAHERTGIFAWYNLVGSLATACGALIGGLLTHGLRVAQMAPVASYRVVLLLYGAAGIVLIFLFARLSSASEPTLRNTDTPAPPTIFGLHRSRGVVAKLSALFALDAFGGGFVVQAILAYWFHIRFGAEVSVLGAIFFGANILAAFSALAAAAVAKRFGLINTMVFTHLPSNVLLLLVPLMPNLPLAAAVLLLRFSISQMDVPTRQSYTVAVVDEDERSAAAGITGIARSVGACLPPLLTGYMLARPGLMSLPFFLAGGIKIAYDLLLYRSFIALRPESGK